MLDRHCGCYLFSSGHCSVKARPLTSTSILADDAGAAIRPLTVVGRSLDEPFATRLWVAANWPGNAHRPQRPTVAEYDAAGLGATLRTTG